MRDYTFHNVIVHTARVWERIRLEQPYQEMPFDNIASVDEIVAIADTVFADKAIQKLISNKGQWDWREETGHESSDSYIESLAEEQILKLINDERNY